MRISIFGMGYVGVVSGACLLRAGHEIVGVDPVSSKVADLAKGQSPIQEPHVAEMLRAGCKAGRLRATSEPREALEGCQMAWVCVGTPSAPDGGLDLSSVLTVTEQIGRGLRGRPERPLIVLRSTCLPGTTAERVIPLLEKESGLRVGQDIHVVFHPEFLREGSAVEDFDNPPKIVVGEESPRAGDTLMRIYEGYEAPRFRLTLGEAEMVKYCDNLFHALKITFANEVAALASSAGLDARRVAEVYCSDTKLNISTRYLSPGFAFGGSCLPKDLKAILRFAAVRSLRIPMIESLPESNKAQIDGLVRRVLACRPDKVGMVGLAFKAGTDDMRNSPYVKVAKALIGEGIKLKIHDPVVRPARLVGSNKEHVQRSLRHLEGLLVESLEDLSDSDLIMINHPLTDAEHINTWLKEGIRVLDLAGSAVTDRHAEGYEGIYW